MLLIISPSKTMDFSKTENEHFSEPRFLKQSKALIKDLKKKSSADLGKLMKISEKLSDLNLQRYQDFSTPFSLKNAKQAILAFKGDVYAGLNVEDFSEVDLEYSQQCLRVVSGLYGLLRPMDLMQPYRLEMGTKLETVKGKNLYEFWGDSITKLINQDLKEGKTDILINLASKEYYKALKEEKIKGDVYNIHFKEEKNGTYKIVAFFAKKARGMMCHYVIKNKLTSPEELKGFNYDNYMFNDELSNERDYIFTR